MDSSAPAQKAATVPKRETRQYRGHYQAAYDTIQFQPCGMKTYDVFAERVGFAALRERYRYTAPWPGARLFAVFTGAIVIDTTPAPDTAKGASPVIRTRFFVAGVDSMRARQPSDCR